MELTRKSINEDRAAFEKAGYWLPSFDYDAIKKNTDARPEWVHFGAGNIFRAFQANVMQNLLNKGAADTGLVAVEGYDYEIIEKTYRPHDNLSILATLKADATVDKTVIGSIDKCNRPWLPVFFYEFIDLIKFVFDIVSLIGKKC